MEDRGRGPHGLTPEPCSPSRASLPGQRAEMALGAGQRTALDGVPMPTSQLGLVQSSATPPLRLLSSHNAYGG